MIWPVGHCLSGSGLLPTISSIYMRNSYTSICGMILAYTYFGLFLTLGLRDLLNRDRNFSKHISKCAAFNF